MRQLSPTRACAFLKTAHLVHNGCVSRIASRANQRICIRERKAVPRQKKTAKTADATSGGKAGQHLPRVPFCAFCAAFFQRRSTYCPPSRRMGLPFLSKGKKNPAVKAFCSRPIIPILPCLALLKNSNLSVQRVLKNSRLREPPRGSRSSW